MLIRIIAALLLITITGMERPTGGVELGDGYKATALDHERLLSSHTESTGEIDYDALVAIEPVFSTSLPASVIRTPERVVIYQAQVAYFARAPPSTLC